MKRRTVRELREKGYRFPRIAWLFERSIIYFLAALAATLGISAIIWQGNQSLSLIKTPYEPPTPYRQISLQETPGSLWAKNFIKKSPDGITNWQVSQNYAPSQPLTFDECNSFGLAPATLLNTYTAKGEKAELVVQLYGPGQTPKIIPQYVDLFKNCWNVKESSEGDPRAKVFRYDDGAFFNYGDALIYIKTSDTKLREELLAYYLIKAAESLKDFECAELEVFESDPYRSPFYDPKNFKGLYQTDKVSTKINLKNLPNPVYQNIDYYEEMEQPEGPLSPSIPTITRQNIRPPEIPNIKTDSPPFDKELQFQIDDPIGPGCGWSWSKQKSPVQDISLLDKRKRSAYKSAYKEVDENAYVWLNEKMGATKNTIQVMTELNQWNMYVKSVNKVHDKWHWLNKERDLIQTNWYNYVEEHNQWLMFDYNKWETQQKYNNEIERCNAKNKEVEEWENQWGEIYRIQQENSGSAATNSSNVIPVPSETTIVSPPSPTPTSPVTGPTDTSTQPKSDPTPTSTTGAPTVEPTPTPTVDIPPRPEGCNYTPKKPYILSQKKPKEPQPPVLKKGVTIPESWPIPRQNAPKIPR